MHEIQSLISLVENLRSVAMILELSENPLSLTYNAARTLEIKEQFPDVKAVTVFECELSGLRFELAEFKNLNAWEVHFDKKTARYQLDVLGAEMKDAGMMRLLATAWSLLRRRLDKGNPIRYYTEDGKLMKLYDRVFGVINASQYSGRIMRQNIKAFRTPDGASLPAVVLRVDMRTLPAPSRHYDECIAVMASLSSQALMARDDDYDYDDWG